MPYAYLIWLALFVITPTICLWLWQYRRLKKYRRIIFLAIGGAIICSLPWDIVAIKERIWYFTTPQIVGIWFLGLPFEEWMFISLVTLSFATMTVLLWEKMGRRI